MESFTTRTDSLGREHARRTGVHHTTVGTIRSELEANGEISHSVERVTADGKPDPEMTNREHARRTGVSHVTVGKLRDELEESGQVDHFAARVDPRTGRASSPPPPRTSTRRPGRSIPSRSSPAAAPSTNYSAKQGPS